MFAKETYTTRRNSLKKRGDRFLAILDNGESGDYADNTYHFRQGSTSLYFWELHYAGLGRVGVTETGSAADLKKCLEKAVAKRQVIH